MISARLNMSWLLLLTYTLVSTGCQAGPYPEAPTNRIIQGPFTITTEWQTIRFDEPLETIPHVQYLRLLLDHDQYDVIFDIPHTEYATVAGMKFYLERSFRLKAASTVVIPQVILIDQHGLEFQALFKATGSNKTKLGSFKSLGFGTDPDEGKFVFDKDAKISAIKVKANVPMPVEHLEWIAKFYYQAPDAKWNDIDPSQIQYFE